MFIQRDLEIRYTLGVGSFREGRNTKVIQGAAARVNIKKPGGYEKNSVEVDIFNLDRSDMEQMTMLAFRPLEANRNYIEIYTVDKLRNLAFAGDVLPGGAQADYSNAPDISFHVSALTGYLDTIQPGAPLSIAGDVSAEELATEIIGETEKTFEYIGDERKIRNPYLTGSPMKKLRDVAKAVNMELIVDDGDVIMTDGQARRGQAVYLSESSGLISYPTFTQVGINFSCIYNPAIRVGGLVVVDSSVPRASGEWRVIGLNSNLNSRIPGGDWSMNIQAALHGFERI